jgi:eukaryotic-like serine/threonine-protein kinase
MSLRNFLTSKTFFKHLILAIAGTLIAVYLVLISLRLYTRHGESIEVPNLYGLTEPEVEQVLDRLDLKYEITDSTYVEHVVAGGVIDQVPESGHRVKQNRTIFITLNAIAPEQVALPRLTDISLRQSLSQLESAGLLAGEITYKPSEFRNLVLEAQISGRTVFAGELVAKGSTVNLVVGSSDAMEMVFLPNLAGLTLSGARQILAESMLSTGAVIYDNSVVSRYDSLNALIWKQHPDSRSILHVPAGSSVDLWVTTDHTLINQEPEADSENTDIEEF